MGSLSRSSILEIEGRGGEGGAICLRRYPIPIASDLFGYLRYLFVQFSFFFHFILSFIVFILVFYPQELCMQSTDVVSHLLALAHRTLCSLSVCMRRGTDSGASVFPAGSRIISIAAPRYLAVELD